MGIVRNGKVVGNESGLFCKVASVGRFALLNRYSSGSFAWSQVDSLDGRDHCILHIWPNCLLKEED